MEPQPPPLDREQLATLLGAVSDGVIITDRAGQALWSNAAYTDLAGEAAQTLDLGNDLQALIYRHEARPKLGLNAGISLLHGAVHADSVTGVLDGASLSRVLEAEVSRSRRYQNPLSIVYLNIAPLKPTADTDAMMSEAAACLRADTRWADNIGRHDVDVLIVVLPETAGDAAAHFVEKIDSLRPPHAQFCWRAGMTQWRKGDDATFLIERARQSMPELAACRP